MGVPTISVLRLGHRLPRDQRVTTHVALTARALGASEILVDRRDGELEARVADVVERFGGPFRIATGVRWREAIRRWPGIVVHLTMYGQPLREVLPSLPRDQDLLVVVGAEKVPRELFDLAHWNVSVGSQPHSEVAALAVFLVEYLGDAALRRSFEGGRLRIIPSPRGRLVVAVDRPPGPGGCEALHRAAGTPEPVVAHCRAVASLASALARAAGADLKLVEAGALLHDIGRSRSHGWEHGPLGAEILRSWGLPGALADIAERHMGAGLTAAEAAARGLGERELLPRSLEEKIVCVADRMTQGTARIGLEGALGRLRSMGLADALPRFRGFVAEIEARAGKPLEAMGLT